MITQRLEFYFVLIQMQMQQDYSILNGNEQLFATKYKTYLPTEEELKAEIESQKAIFEIQQQEKNENNLKTEKDV